MPNFLKFVDAVEFRPIETDRLSAIKDNYTNNPQPIVVKIAATHAGIITRNNGFYLPDRMRKGAPSFTAQYGKPIQVHHDDGADPVGRVLKSDYVDISSVVRDKFMSRVKDNLSVARQIVTLNFLDGKLPFIESVNFISDNFARYDSILEDPDYQGLGFIQLTAQISDPAAIQKILDGRYLTGSVGVTTNRAVCSVCKQDWTGDDGRCEHRPGKSYDGTKAFIITGDLIYDEYSFVNVPADRHSRVMEVNVNGITDSVTMENSFGKTIAVTVITDSIDTVTQEEKVLMDKKKKLIELLSALRGKYPLLDDTKISDLTKSLEEDPEEDVSALDVEHRLDRLAVTQIFGLEDKLETLKTIRTFMEVSALEKVVADKFADVEAFYAALMIAEWNDYAESEDEALIKYLSDNISAAVLTAAQRKRLPGSSFCGANKSFPVADVSHVEPTRVLINLASASIAVKVELLDRVNCKALALAAIAPVKKDNVETPVVETTPAADQVACASCDSLKVQLDKVTTDLTALQVQFNTLTAELTSKSATLDAVQFELRASHTDLTQMADQLITVKEEAVGYLADKVLVFKTLSGEKIEDAVKAREELVSLGETAVKDQLTEISAKVDMNKITDSINSGLARNPNGSVEDPTGNVPAAKKFDPAKMQAVQAKYLSLCLGGVDAFYGKGKDAAERFKKDMQSRGIIPFGKEANL